MTPKQALIDRLNKQTLVTPLSDKISRQLEGKEEYIRVYIEGKKPSPIKMLNMPNREKNEYLFGIFPTLERMNFGKMVCAKYQKAARLA